MARRSNKHSMKKMKKMMKKRCGGSDPKGSSWFSAPSVSSMSSMVPFMSSASAAKAARVVVDTTTKQPVVAPGAPEAVVAPPVDPGAPEAEKLVDDKALAATPETATREGGRRRRRTAKKSKKSRKSRKSRRR